MGANFGDVRHTTTDASDASLLETRTIGVVCVVIHEARHLLAADFNGSSDPYVLVSFANVGKSLYATKVKKDSLNPIFEELAIVKITQEELDEEDE